ncbi:hypothetical protein LX36DRAFT_490105 [Colletotrichum falcatum]|nr:hypothetical protein LX36DRAFT_490105 [Colletotrichum falcatum]
MTDFESMISDTGIQLNPSWPLEDNTNTPMANPQYQLTLSNSRSYTGTNVSAFNRPFACPWLELGRNPWSSNLSVSTFLLLPGIYIHLVDGEFLLLNEQMSAILSTAWRPAVSLLETVWIICNSWSAGSHESQVVESMHYSEFRQPRPYNPWFQRYRHFLPKMLGVRIPTMIWLWRPSSKLTDEYFI